MMMPARQLVARARWCSAAARRLSRRGALRHHPHVVQPAVQRCCSSRDSPAAPTSSTPPAQAAATSLVCLAPSEAHLSRLAALLAATRAPGDAYCLRGAVGAGKSVFSRAFIRAAAGDAGLPVPSPTYLLQIIYDDHDGPPIHHFDLYRLQQQQQPGQQQQQLQPADAPSLSRLDLPASYGAAVCLLEWADVLPPELVPHQRLEVTITALSRQQQQQVVVQQQRQVATQQSGAGGAAAAAAAQPSSSEGPPQQQQQQPQQQVRFIQLPQSNGSSTTPAGASCERDSGAAAYGEADGAAGDQPEQLDALAAVEEAEEEDDPFADTHWRLVELVGVGPAWRQRLANVAQQL